MRFISYLAPTLAILPSALSAVLHTDSRWILDSNNQRYKLRCVNWAGHLETNTPEGLQHKPIDYITSWIANAGFNCVRLTYSIDMALSPNTSVSDSFTSAGNTSGAGVPELQALYASAVQQNPFLSTATRLATFDAVITSLAAHNVNVILDNHVSKAIWCCNLTDGNGWWDQAAGYNPLTSIYFNTPNWLSGLSAMANFALGHSNVIGMSLRNEIRSLPPQNLNNEADWYTFVGKGANTIHAANPNLLIIIGGVAGATDFGFQRSVKPLDTTSFAGKAVWEYHTYSFSVGYVTSNCDIYTAEMGAAAGYLLEQNQAWTGPLWLSEFGVGQNGVNGTLSSGDESYLSCLVSYMESNDADWAVWALQGDYYIREGQSSVEESYGMLDPTWTDWQNPLFKGMLGGMWNVTQGP